VTPARGPLRRARGLAPLAAGLGALAAGLLAPITAPAQDGPAQLLTLGLSTGLAANTNRRLDPDDAEGSAALTTGLSFAYRDATPLQSFALSSDLTLRQSRGTGDDGADGLTDPNLNFAWERAVRDSAIGISGSVRRSEVDFLRPLETLLLTPGDPFAEVDDPLPDLDDPLTDLDDLTATLERGTRLSYRLETSLQLRRTAPFGIDLSAGLSGTRYSDTDDSELADDQRYRVGAGLRFALDPVTEASLGLRYSFIDEEDEGDEDDGDEGDEGRRETTTLTAAVSRRYPLGVIGLSANVAQTDTGERYGLSANAGRSGVGWSLSGSTGVAVDEDGDATFQGGLQANRALATGRVGLGFDRSLRTGDESDITVTALSINYGTRLTPLLSVTADASWIRTDEAEDDTAEAARLGLSLSRSLTEDWALSAGVVQRFRDDEDGSATDTALTVGLRRSFAFVP
jgi:hypothetical protein